VSQRTERARTWARTMPAPSRCSSPWCCAVRRSTTRSPPAPPTPPQQNADESPAHW